MNPVDFGLNPKDYHWPPANPSASPDFGGGSVTLVRWVSGPTPMEGPLWGAMEWDESGSGGLFSADLSHLRVMGRFLGGLAPNPEASRLVT